MSKRRRKPGLYDPKKMGEETGRLLVWVLPVLIVLAIIYHLAA